MRSKKLLAGVLAASMVLTSIQFPPAKVKAEETRNSLTLWYMVQIIQENSLSTTMTTY